MILTGRQIREGRILAGMTQSDLARAAKVDLVLVMRAEVAVGPPTISERDGLAIQRALEAAGVEFIPENGGGAGVRLRKGELG